MIEFPPTICVSLRRPDEQALLAATVRAVDAGAKLVEWRLDGLRAPPIWPQRLDRLPCPVIVACRRPVDGGDFVGSEANRLNMLREADAQGASWIDIEADAIEALGPLKTARRLVSWHDLSGTPADLPARHRALCALRADACKLVTTATRPEDNATLLALSASSGTPTVAFCMGAQGRPSRLLAVRAGAPWTYASESDDRAVAPGQLAIATMRGLYRHDEIDLQTRLLVLIGDPVDQSIGPEVHNAALSAMGLNFRYLALKVSSEQLGDLLALTDHLSIDGMSVTAPHKRAVLALCEPDEETAKVGACNTLVRRDGGWRGHNTDLSAALLTVRQAWRRAHGPDRPLRGIRALLLGSGGVARAVAFGLKQAGVELKIAGRDPRRREALAMAVGGEAVVWSARHEQRCELLVNCTPVGMAPHSEDTPFEAEALRPETLVFDTIYRPHPTTLLRAAAARGCPTADGLELFIAQAEAQLRLFTGRVPPLGLCRRAALAALSPTEPPPALSAPSPLKPPLRLHAPPSKSATHRLMLLAALSDTPCTLRRPLLGADCRATLAVLQALGARATVGPEGDLHFDGFSPQAPTATPDHGNATLDRGNATLDCGNSGTTLRLMIGQAARWPFASTLSGDASLRQRPNGPLLDALRQLGAEVEAHDGRAPITVRGPLAPPPPGGRLLKLPGGLSSQFTSSLLLTLALAEGPSTLHLSHPLASRPYLDLTIALATSFGLTIEQYKEETGVRFWLPGSQRPLPPKTKTLKVEGDWSGAAFTLVAAALSGIPLELRGLRWGSAQGDRAIVPLLRTFGADLQLEEILIESESPRESEPPTERETRIHLSPGPLRSPGTIDLKDVPDLFPALCALAACAQGHTRLHGSPGLRHKECDRIATMAEGLRAMGVRCEELPDGLVIEGGRPRGARVACRGDHRVHMAFSILALVAEGESQIDHEACVAVSYPDFHTHRAAFAARLAADPDQT